MATLSRAGWLARAVGVGAWAALRFRGQPRRLLGLGVGGLAVAALAAAMAGPSALFERVANALVAPTRVQLWGTALHGFSWRPIFGWGLDTFVLVDQQLRHPEAWKYEWGGTAGHAHSFPAQVLATQGVVGAAVTVALVAFVLRAWRRAPSPLVAPVLGLAAASLVAFSGALVLSLGWCVLAGSLPGVERRMPRGAWYLTLAPLVATAMLFGASLAGAAAERAPLSLEGAGAGRRREPDPVAALASSRPRTAPEFGAPDSGPRTLTDVLASTAPAATGLEGTGIAAGASEPAGRSGPSAAPARRLPLSRRGPARPVDLRVAGAPRAVARAAGAPRRGPRAVRAGGAALPGGRCLRGQRGPGRREAAGRAGGALLVRARAAPRAARRAHSRSTRPTPRCAWGSCRSPRARSARCWPPTRPMDRRGSRWRGSASPSTARWRRAQLEASLDADWRDWPGGLGVARTVLAALQEGLGDPALAAQAPPPSRCRGTSAASPRGSTALGADHTSNKVCRP